MYLPWSRRILGFRRTVTTLLALWQTTTGQSTPSSAGAMNYCTYETQPYTTCSDDGTVYGIGSTIMNTVETFGGNFQTKYTVTCLSSRTEVIEKLKSCECDAAFGDFTMNTLSTVRGSDIKTSLPFHPTVYAVIQRSAERKTTMWGIFKPFTTQLWFLVLFTPLALAACMTYFSWAISRYKKTRFSWSVLPQYLFQNAMSFLNDYTKIEYMDWHGKQPYMYILKFSLQTMLVSYAFLCLVVTSVYTAELTSIILARDMLQEKLSFSDIVKRESSVVVPVDLEDYFKIRYNVIADIWVPDSTQNLSTEVDRLRSGDSDALVVSVGQALWTLDTQNRDCKLSVNVGAYQPVSGFGFLFSPCVNSSSIDARNKIITELGQRGILEAQSETTLGDYYVTRRPYPCIVKNSGVTIRDVAGAWVILAICVAVPFLFTLSRYLYYLLAKCFSIYGNFFVVGTPTSSQAQSNTKDDTFHHDELGPGYSSTHLHGDVSRRSGYAYAEIARCTPSVQPHRPSVSTHTDYEWDAGQTYAEWVQMGNGPEPSWSVYNDDSRRGIRTPTTTPRTSKSPRTSCTIGKEEKHSVADDESYTQTPCDMVCHSNATSTSTRSSIPVVRTSNVHQTSHLYTSEEPSFRIGVGPFDDVRADTPPFSRTESSSSPCLEFRDDDMV